MNKDDLKLPLTAQKALEEFLVYAGDSAKSEFGSIDPRAWSKFYDFILVCHTRAIDPLTLSDSRVKAIFLAEGFSESNASNLAQVYYHGRKLVKHKLPLYARSWEAYYDQKIVDLAIQLENDIRSQSNQLASSVESIRRNGIKAKKYPKVVEKARYALFSRLNDLSQLSNEVSSAIREFEEILQQYK